MSAKPPTWRDTVCIVTDGDQRPGSWYVSTKTPWPAWFAAMEHYPHLIVHLPFGNDDRPMQFASRSLLVGRAAANPDDANLQAKADVAAFTAGLTARTDKGLWTGIYVGGLDTYKAIDGETSIEWCERALAELEPYLDGMPDAMFFDATQGPAHPGTHHDFVVWGVGGGAHRLTNELQRQGIEVGIEPNAYEDYPLLHELSVLLTDQWWYGREVPAARRAMLGLPGSGDSRWDTGSFKERPLHPAGEHRRVYRLIYNWPKVPGDYERFVRLARIDGHIPCVRYLDLRDGRCDLRGTEVSE